MYDSAPRPTQKIARIARPINAPATFSVNPKGIVTSTSTTVWPSIGTISFNARPMINAGLRSGETSIRSCEPVCISYSRFAPVADAPNRHDITTMPGTNHCSDESPGSRGANNAKKNSGWTMVKITENGLRSTGRNSRVNTVRMSVTRLVFRVTVVMPSSPSGKRLHAGCGRSG